MHSHSAYSIRCLISIWLGARLLFVRFVLFNNFHATAYLLAPAECRARQQCTVRILFFSFHLWFVDCSRLHEQTFCMPYQNNLHVHINQQNIAAVSEWHRAELDRGETLISLEQNRKTEFKQKPRRKTMSAERTITACRIRSFSLRLIFDKYPRGMVDGRLEVQFHHSHSIFGFSSFLSSNYINTANSCHHSRTLAVHLLEKWTEQRTKSAWVRCLEPQINFETFSILQFCTSFDIYLSGKSEHHWFRWMLENRKSIWWRQVFTQQQTSNFVYSLNAYYGTHAGQQLIHNSYDYYYYYTFRYGGKNFEQEHSTCFRGNRIVSFSRLIGLVRHHEKKKQRCSFNRLAEDQWDGRIGLLSSILLEIKGMLSKKIFALA